MAFLYSTISFRNKITGKVIEEVNIQKKDIDNSILIWTSQLISQMSTLLSDPQAIMSPFN